MKKMYSALSLRTLCLVQVYNTASTQCNSEMRDLFSSLPTPILNAFLGYAHFKFITNPGFTELDIFNLAEEIIDQRQFTFFGNSEQNDFSLDEMIRQCGYFSSAEVCTYVHNVSNSVLRSLRRAYNREGCSEIIRKILNKRHRDNL